MLQEVGSKKDTPRVVELAVSKKALRRLRVEAEEYFGERWPTTTTTDMVLQFIKPRTASRHCRFAELPGCLHEDEIGQPTYFISHAWKAPAELLFRRIEEFLGDADDATRVWVDCFAVNQHSGEGVNHNQNKEDVSAFEDVVIASEGGTLVVVGDVQKFNPATRGWCIYEWDHTILHHGPDSLHMPLGSSSDRAELIASIDVANAECFMEADKAMILENVVMHHKSLEAFNDKLKLHLLLEPLSFKVDTEQHLLRSQHTEWRFADVQRWAEGDVRALCIAGEGGTGKSTISTAIIREQQRTPGQVIVVHYLKFSDQRRLDPIRIIKSLAAQLATR